MRTVQDGTRGIAAAIFAVVLWGIAPVLVEIAEQLPPLELAALCLAAAAATTAPATRQGRYHGPPPVKVWLLAPPLIVGALAFYFAALRLAPPAHAALVTYTWPVMFVIAAELCSRGRLRPAVITGVALAFAGAALVLSGQAGGGLNGIPWIGYGSAVASGLCWAAFSLLASRADRPLGPCLPRLFGLAVLWAAVGHALVEHTVWPPSPEVAGWVLLIGAGPYGIAFVAWDRALRLGPPATVGSLAYAVPIISATLLVVTGAAAPEWRLPVAAAAVMAGCVIASRATMAARAS